MLKAEGCVLRNQEAFRETGKRYIDIAVKIQTKFKFCKAVKEGGKGESLAGGRDLESQL